MNVESAAKRKEFRHLERRRLAQLNNQGPTNDTQSRNHFTKRQPGELRTQRPVSIIT